MSDWSMVADFNFTNPRKSFEDARAAADERRLQATRARAVRSRSREDRDDLLAQGDLPMVRQLDGEAAAQQATEFRESLKPRIASGDLAGAQSEAAIEGYDEIATAIKGMRDDERAEAKMKVDTLAKSVFPMMQLPPEQRVEYWQRKSAELAQQGYNPEELASIDTSDVGLKTTMFQAMTLNDILTNAGRERDDARADQQFEETKRHNQATEGATSARIGLAERKDGRVAARAAGGGGARRAPALPPGFVWEK